MRTLLALLLLSGAVLAQSGSAPIWTTSPNTLLGVGGATITIHPDGTVTLREGLTLDEASKAFWDVVQQMGMKLACEAK